MARAVLTRHLVTASTASQSEQHLRAGFRSGPALLSSQMSQAEQKAALRQSVKQELRKLSPEVMTKESQAIAQQVVHSQFFQQARTVGIYLHCTKLREVDTTPIVSAAVEAGVGKQCFVPLVEDRNANMRLLHLDSLEGLVAVPPFNIYEPKPSYVTGVPRQDALVMEQPLELLLMPGLAFDRQGHRLGRGGGDEVNFLRQQLTQGNRTSVPSLHVWRMDTSYLCALPEHMTRTMPTDVILTAEGQEFPAHQFVLGVNSAVFAEFLSQARSSSNHSVDQLIIPLVNEAAKDVCTALTYYRGCAVMSPSKPDLKSTEDAISLAKFAHKYDVTDLVCECES